MTNSLRSPALALLLLGGCLPTYDRPAGDDPPRELADLGVGVPPWSEVSGASTTHAVTTSSTTASTNATNASTASGTSSDSGTSAAEPPVSLHGLRLTEVLVDPPGKDGGPSGPEYVELVHTGDESIPLGSLVLLARSWPELDARALGLASEHLAPGERLLVRRFASADEADALGVTREGPLVTATIHTSSGLRNDDGAVMLRGIDGTIVDAVVYGGPAPSPYDAPEAWIGEAVAKPTAGASLCRQDPKIDHDDASDWIECAPSPGVIEDLSTTGDFMDTTGDATSDPSTEGTTTIAEGIGALAIVEVYSNPPGPSSEERALEFVEILNLGDAPVDLSAMTIADDLEVDAPGRDPLLYREGDGGCGPIACLAPGRRALIVGNLYTGPTGGALVLETDDTTIADGGLSAAEPVVLRDDADLVLSTYRAWDDPTSEPYPLAVESPLQRLTPEAVDAPASWVYAEPTPGLP